MTAIAWLDYSERERRTANELLKLFTERDTVDELGIGTIRDALSDVLFPGTSILHTRARYCFFIPWIYQDLEAKRTPASVIAERARRKEIALIDALLASDDPRGTIGQRARAMLKVLPSAMYWYGLGRWGIRRYPGNRTAYHTHLDRYYVAQRHVVRSEDREVIYGDARPNWDPALPSPPTDFPKSASFDLTTEEAEYLSERIQTSAPTSLFAHLVSFAKGSSSVDFAWMHPHYASFPNHNKEQLEHARCFSEVLHGASVLYNLEVARIEPPRADVEEYEALLETWGGTIRERSKAIANWSLNDFWDLLFNVSARIPMPTRRFVDAWVGLVRNEGPDALHSAKSTRSLVVDRERALKRGLARVDNQRARELWRGHSGTRQLDYRWKNVEQYVRDIHTALGWSTDA